ncbi:MAG TPA: flagellar basal body P-ring protein FlgI [Burkholderiaceae bacterium]
MTSPLHRWLAALALVCATALIGSPAWAVNDPSGEALRAKDLGKIQGWRENALTGYGIVTGLAGTGDSPSNRATRQALSNVLSQFNLSVPPDQVQSRNVAAVMISAQLPAFAKPGDTVDVTVTSIGEARSLVGGSLLLAPLKAPNGRVYALAQGVLSVGGYRYDANGNVVQKNHPTVGSIPGGATVETALPQRPANEASVTFVLQDADYTTAVRLADAVNAQLGAGLAEARDASGVEVHIPDQYAAHPVVFMARLENVLVIPDRRAKVVINERTGTVVAGGDVRISKVAISHGDLRVSIATETTASQPVVIGGSGPGVRTALVSNSQVNVNEGEGAVFVSADNTVGDLVRALTRLHIGTRDTISILRAIKAAGALHAELVVQ